MENQLDKNRLYHGYYLNDWDELESYPCKLCELSDECDRISDDLNKIEFCMCLSKGCINDTKYKINHKNAYFKKIT